MKSWSQDCLGKMKAVLFLDTNILSYLVDETYPLLTRMISDFRDTCVIDLISSEYCQLEFVGIRKREHYLRSVIKKASEDYKTINCSSLLKYHNQFECREIDFHTILPDIRSAVNEDIKRIVRDFDISFTCKIHSDLFLPISEICLHSKISKEDSFVIISSVNPQPNRYNPVCFVLTHDRDFNKWHTQAQAELSQIYQAHQLPEPIMIHQNNAFGINLDSTTYDFTTIKENFMEQFIAKNDAFYLGRTIEPKGDNAPHGMFALHIATQNPILTNKYITIIGKDLDFCITTPTPIRLFHRNSEIENGFVFKQVGEDIVTGIFLQESPANEKLFTDEEYMDILVQIQSEGNYVFYHCDTFE